MAQSLVAVVQYATALTFLVIGLTAYRYGDGGQQAAEAEVVRQGFSAGLLHRHRVRIAESRVELLLPLAIALLLAALATLNLVNAELGHTVTWIVQPVLLLAGGFITATQVFVHRFVAATLRRSSDPEARAVDTRAVLDAANAVFPRWLRPMVIIRFILVTAGSAAVIALLLTAD